MLELHPARGEQYWHALLRRYKWSTVPVEIYDVAEQVRALGDVSIEQACNAV